MSRGRWLIVIALIAVGVLWGPVLKPAGQATILLADIYSEQLVGMNLAHAVTPQPRVIETDDRFADIAMRVTYWRPGWGDEHPHPSSGLVEQGEQSRALNDSAPLERAGCTDCGRLLPSAPSSRSGGRTLPP